MAKFIMSRRGFTAALSGFGLLATACATNVASLSKPENVSEPSHTGDEHAMTAGAVSASDAESANKSVRELADEMDAHHEERMKMFPAKTAGRGNQPLQPRIENGVKVFELVATNMQWEVEPGRMVEAMAYNEQVPGPEIRVTEGDQVRIVLRNEMKDSTAIHFHGLVTPNAMDGVPFITQPPVKPGETFTYEFVAKPVGSHMYHSHHDSAKQVSLGLLGAFIVEPKDPSTRPSFDREYTMILNDGQHGYTLNGKSFPATEPLTAKLGDKVLVRFMNEGMMIHPMHLHGMPMQIIAKDGYLLPQPFYCDTLNIAPGERWDAIILADNPGTWAFHCHILSHAESSAGMFGMVTVLIVEP